LTLKLVPSRDANYSGGLLGMFAALAGSDPNPPVSPDDEQEQADLQTLEDRLSSSGNINDAWALYKAASPAGAGDRLSLRRRANHRHIDIIAGIF
jgi:hypothetical protein